MVPSYATRLLRLTFLAPDIVTAILAGKQPAGLCQSNARSSARGATRPPSSHLSCEGAPLGQRGRAPLFVDLAGDEMALLIEMVVDLGMN